MFDGGRDDEAPGLTARLGEWRRESPLDRTVPFAAAGLWVFGAGLHAIGARPAWVAALAAIAVVTTAYSGHVRHAADPDKVSGGEAAALAVLAGGWVTAAAALGPLGGRFPAWWVTWAWAALTACTWWWLAGHRSIAAAQRHRDRAGQWQARKARWNSQLAPLLDMNGYYLRDQADTLLGEELHVKAGDLHARRARQIYANRDALMEDLARHEGVPYGACDMELTDMPGELVIRIRRSDPWASPVWHPVLRPDASYAGLCPEQATITEPLCVGLDPETGAPLLLTLWDERGAKVVAIFAKKDAGKTTALDSATERITACDDARLLQINLSKALEDGWWAELADASALDTDTGRAFGILRFAADGIGARPRSGRRVKVHQPTRDEPCYVIKIDEIDAAVDEDPVRAKRLLGYICGKCRSEGFAVLLATQRGIQAVLGGGMVQANIDIVMWGKFARLSELDNVAGRSAGLPDMGEYGQRNPGVFAIAELPFTGELQRGRVFYWGETDEGHRRVVARRRKRRGHRLEPALAGLAGQWERVCRPGEYDWRHDPEWAGEMPGDTTITPGGAVVPGTELLRARIGAALAVPEGGTAGAAPRV